MELSTQFRRVLRADGVILASGFERLEVEEVSQAFPALREVRHKENWSLIVA